MSYCHMLRHARFWEWMSYGSNLLQAGARGRHECSFLGLSCGRLLIRNCLVHPFSIMQLMGWLRDPLFAFFLKDDCYKVHRVQS